MAGEIQTTQPNERVIKFPMSDVDPIIAGQDSGAEFDMVFDDGGKLNIVPRKKEAPANPQGETPQESANPGGTNPPSPTEVNQYTTRITELESKLDRMAGFMAAYFEKAGAPQNPAAPENTEINPADYDMQESQGMAKFISDVVNKALKDQVQPLQGTMSDMQMTIAFQNAKDRFGKDFSDKLNDVVTLMKEDRNMTFENAYMLIKGKEAITKGNAHAESQTQQRTQLSAQELADKASALSTDSRNGVSEAVPNGKQSGGKFSNLKEAFESAFDDLYGNR